MFGLVSAKKYKNTSTYRSAELNKLRKHYDEVLAPRVDVAFAEMRERWNQSQDEVNLDWMMDTRPIEKIN